MRQIFPLVALAAAGVFGACGGSPQKPQNVSTLPSAQTSASAAPPAVDLSPVSMPDSVVLLIHAAHPSSTGDVLSDWAGTPLDIDQVLGEMVGEKLAKAVDLDAPADLVITAQDRGGRHEPEIREAVALPVKSFDAAKSAIQADYGLLPVGNGAFEIDRKGRHRDGDSDFRSCALAPSTSGGRIVCSRDASSRDAVLPYLTRGTSNIQSKSDVHLEARPGPFRELVKRERASITASGARFMGGGSNLRVAWEEAIADLCDGFLDSDRASLDANIDSKAGAADLKIVAKGSRALITRILTGHPERAEAVPAAFLKLPQEADLAFFSHGLDADQVALPRDELVRGVDSQLQAESKLKDVDRKAFTDALAHTFDLLTMPIVYARGVDFAKAIPAVSGLTEASDAAKIRAGIEQAAGWDVIGVEGAPDRVTAIFKEWTSVLARPALVTELGSEAPKWRLAGASRGAPAGAVHLALSYSREDWDYSAAGKPKKRPPITLTLHTLIVPDGSRAWIVSALDEATAVAKAKSILAGQGTLASREGLDALKTARLNAGGFVTPRGAGLGLPITWLFTGNWRWKASNDPLLGISSQSQYTTPVVFSYVEGAGQGEQGLTLSLRVPRAALADALVVGPRIFR